MVKVTVSVCQRDPPQNIEIYTETASKPRSEKIKSVPDMQEIKLYSYSNIITRRIIVHSLYILFIVEHLTARERAPFT